jgi:hypothetical protein
MKLCHINPETGIPSILKKIVISEKTYKHGKYVAITTNETI